MGSITHAEGEKQLQKQKNKLFMGRFVHSKTLTHLEYLDPAAVCVDRAGRIVAVERNCVDRDRAVATLFPRLGWADDDAEVEVLVAGEGQFFFPGFIDTHIHAPQYPNAGIFGKTTLMDWLSTYTFPMEASMADAGRARRVYGRVVRRTLAHGTTCAAYFATVHVAATNLLADLCLAAGQRALVGRVCMDQLAPDDCRDADADAALAATRETIEHITRAATDYRTKNNSNDTDDDNKKNPTAPLVRPIITPRFAPSCSPPLMRRLAALSAAHDLPIQTHISENAGEMAAVRQLFPRALTTAADDTYAAVYDAYGLLTPRTVLAHAVHLADSEVALVAARGSKVSHCPCSNSALGSGAARVRRLLDAGIACGLGTDVSGGYSASVLEAARQAVLVSRLVEFTTAPGGGGDRDKLSVEEVLFLATRGGAEVVGLQGVVGAFEVGMEWDAQLVDLGEGKEEEEEQEAEEGPVDVFGWETWEDRVAKWLFGGDDRNTKKVWVQGRLVHERGVRL